MINEHPLRDVLLNAIRYRIDNHPRSLQKEIGPSEVGHPCDRWLGYKLSDTPTVGRSTDKWRPTVGVAVHKWLDTTFEEADKLLFSLLQNHVWLTENRVNVGTIRGPDGYDVYGSVDLYSVLHSMPVDWKIVGKTTLDSVRRKKHPGDQYRTQIHLYGRGYLRAGYPVSDVGVFFLPASGTLDEGILWHEPFDESVAVNALDRLSNIQAVVQTHGVNAPGKLPAVEHYCTRCEWYQPKSTDLSVGCPGVGIKESKVHDLLG